MSWLKAGRGAAAAAIAGALLVVAGWWSGFAFYAPQRGRLAEAAAQAAETAERRDRVRVVVGEEMAAGGAGRPTLATVSRFFALEEDTLPCTVAENHGEAARERAAQQAARPLQVGTEVVLCLD